MQVDSECTFNKEKLLNQPNSIIKQFGTGSRINGCYRLCWQIRHGNDCNDNEYIFHEGLLVQVTDEDCNRHDIICEYNFTMLLSRLTNT